MKLIHTAPFMIAAALLGGSCTRPALPLRLADPMVGTGFHGHTFPGAATPFGAVQLSPDTRSGNWDACSGYHYSDSTIDGFSHTHLSGTGCCDLGDILISPEAEPFSFSHADEIARPGYYSVKSKSGVLSELTATPHVGVHRYSFPVGSTPRIHIDIAHTISGERISRKDMKVSAPDCVEGYRITQGWTPDHQVCFSAKFSRPFADYTFSPDSSRLTLSFLPGDSPIEVAVGISGVDPLHAALNRMEEVPILNFDSVASRTAGTWENELDKIIVEGGTETQRRNFYSALYHTMIAPNLVSDFNKPLRYSTLSLWDTYRAWHPLINLIRPDLTADIIDSMLERFDRDGVLPVWPLADGETNCMIGYHAASVIADAYICGLRTFDAERALKAMIASANTSRKGADIYARLGYIPCESNSESVSCALEYAYDDWCIARMAEAMGELETAAEYYRRAASFANIFDGKTRFFRGRRSDGGRDTVFNPAAVSRDLTEATPWQYRFAPVHDIAGLISLFGGKERLEGALDSIFDTDAKVIGELSDITGLIGQYAHGNEPSHHVAYLYNYTGSPWKTQAMTRRILDELYQPTPEGICGNEDCGQMSAWYVITALGLYPVAPGSGEYNLTAPLFPKATISLPNEKKLTITANNPDKYKYIRSVKFNGRPVDTNFIRYSDLIKGGELKFDLSPIPVKTRGTSANASPYSMSKIARVSVPYIDKDLHMFRDSVTFSMGCATDSAIIRYTLDGSVPDQCSPAYASHLTLANSAPVTIRAFREGYLPSAILSIKATKAEYLEALPDISEADLHPGVRYFYMEGPFKKCADMKNISAANHGILAEPSISSARCDDHFGFIFNGYILVPETGVYTFRTTSDDGSILLIDGLQVVDNDGGHSLAAATGQVALKAGFHRFEIQYFENYDGEAFSWSWKLPGSDRFITIPPSNLYYK